MDPRLGQLGNAGIVGTNVGLLSIGGQGPNTFSHLAFGVNLERYNSLLCNGVTFQNMRPGGTSSIRLVGQNTNGTSNIANNQFLTGTIALTIAQCNGTIDIKTNIFTNHVSQPIGIGRGIFAFDCADLKLRIQNSNVFSTTNIPISVQNIRAGEVKIQNNTFNTSNRNILVSSIVPLCLIESNTMNTVGLKGIEVSNMTAATIRLNSINANGQLGIRASSSPNILIFKNTINNGNSTSFSVENSENFNAQCNTLNFCNRGLNISSTILGGLLKTNVMNNITTQSLRLSNCAIGTQDKHGNLFPSTNSTGQLINSLVADNTFLFRNSSPPAVQSWFPITPIGVPAGQTWFQEVSSGSNLICGTQPQASSLPSSSQLVNAVNGSVLNNLYYDQNVWSSRWYAMHSLANNPTLMNGNATLTNFYNGPSVVKSYYDMNKNIDRLYDFTASELSTLNGFSLTLNTKLDELDALQALVTDQNYIQYIVPINAKNDEIMVIIDAINPIVNAATTRGLSNALLYKAAVLNLAEPKYFCDEYKVLYNARLDAILYGETYAKNHYASELSSLASKCHLDFGYPVHAAISLCNQYGLPYMYSECDAVQPRQAEAMSQTENELKIYPNPTSHRLMIESTLPLINCTLMDLGGRQVIFDKINGLLDVDLDVSGIGNGVYFLKVTDENGKSHVKKIVKL
jgi:hypothetical protein